VDSGFNSAPNSNVFSAVLQADGKIIVGGSFTNLAGTARNRIARLNSDGTLDAGFNPNASGDVNAIAVQADGKIVIGGAFTNVVSTTRNRIARLNADGTLDTGFNPSATNVVNSIAIQPDGKIIVGGNFTNIAATLRNRIARLNTDGTLDTNFNPNASSNVYAIALQLDGKILVGGDFTNVVATTRNYFARLNADGTLDGAFNPNPSNSVYNAAVQADGKIIIGGTFTNVAATARNRIARLNADGTLDSGFNPNASNVVNSVVLQADGKIIIAGTFTNVGGATVRNRIARLNTNGTLESTFDPNVGGVVSGVAVQADGQVIVGGTFTNVSATVRTNLARVLNDAATQSLTVPSANRIQWLRGDASPEAQSVAFDFSTDGGVSWIALGSGVRIANGWEMTGLSLPTSGLVRGRARVPSGIYNGSSGLLEASAGFSGFTASAPLVTTGSATNVADVTASLTATINPAGAPTIAQFEYGTTTNYGSVANIVLSPTNGASAQNVITAISGLTPGTNYNFRAIASNSVGLTFGSNQTFSTPLYPDIAVEHPAGTNLTDGTGSISFGLSLVGVTNQPRTFIVRNVGLTNLTGLVITKDGTHSNDFTLNTNGMSTTLAPGGSTTFSLVFTAAATGLRTAAVHIASSDPDENPFDIVLIGSGYQPGNVDTNFIIGTGNTAHSMAVQPDGRVLIGGFFTTVGSVARSRLARFNTDGTLDGVFNPNANGDAYSLAVQGDGKILVGGGFSTIAGASRNRIARLNADGTIDAAFDPNISTGFTVYNLTVLPDGKILLAGDFTVIAGATRNRIARLNANGTLDTNFNPNVNNTIFSYAVQADGKILIGGLFTTVGGVTRNNFARLNADGSLDTGFAPTVVGTVYCIAVQTDGKILLGGTINTVNSTARSSFARLNADGTLDSFNPAPNGTIYSLALQADGKLIIAGSYDTIAATARGRVARFNTNNVLDGVFNPNANSLVYGLAMQGDGMVVLGGQFTTVGTLPRTNIARVFNDGITQALTVASANRIEWLRGGALPEAQSVTFDFSTDGGTNWIALSAGSRISGGWELTGFTLPSSGLIRGRARSVSGGYNGSAGLTEVTASFSGFSGSAPLVATGGASNITDIAATLYAVVNPAGAGTTAIFEYGTTTNYGSIASISFSPTNGATTQAVSAAVSGLTPGTTHHYRIVASNSVGTTYGNDLTFTTLLYPDIVVEQPSGTNLVDGLSTNDFGFSLLGTTNAPRTFIIRNIGLTNLTGLAITKDGTHSNDFILDTNGMSTSIAPGASTAFNVIFVTGSTGTRTAAIHIANNDPNENPFDIALVGNGYRAGDLETNFNPSATGSSVSISGLAIQPDGKMILGGDFTGISGTTRGFLVRLNLDGTIDPAFTNANASVRTVVLQPDGKVLFGGDFTLVAGVSRNRIARLNANGTLDMTFSNTVGGTVYNMALQPDGKVLIGGTFATVGGVSRLRFARLNADGSLDGTFVTNTPNQDVNALAVLPDGKIMIGGNFTTYGGAARTNIARLNSNGSLDTTFTNTIGGSPGTVYCIVIQPDGRMLAGGDFSSANGASRNKFARFNTDGTLDNLDLNANGTVHSIALQTDGKILAGGSFFNVKLNQPRNYIARLNADGTLDSFNPGSGSDVYGIAIQPDGKIVVGGFFTTMGGVTRNRIARLWNDGVTESFSVASANRVEWLRGGALMDVPGVTFDFSTDGGVNWIALGAGTPISGGWELTGLSLPPAGQVRARARTFSGRNNGSSGLTETNAAFSGFTPSPPVVFTTAATSINVLSATLNASINPSGVATAAQFEYGTTTNYGSIASITLSPTNGAAAQNVSAAIAGLTGGTIYHFRAIASNSVGITYGSNVTFMTLVQPEIAVEQPAGTNLTDGVSSVSFGVGLVGNPGTTRTFTVRNDGVADLTGLAIAKSGAHAADFTVDTNAMSTTVAPAGTTTFTVTFVPTVIGARTASIQITNNDSDENPFDITLTGTAARAGDVETNFNASASDNVNSIALQTDGKIVAGGLFTTMNGVTRSNLARLNIDGTTDSTFNPTSNFQVVSTTIQPDGKLLIGGYFTTAGGLARNRIARINTNGTVDASFNPNASAAVRGIALQPDGKIIMSGDFTNVAGLTRNRLARLNSDGTMDTNYNPNANDQVYTAVPQSDGKLLIGGAFTSIGGVGRNRIARLNSDGTVDSGFNPNADLFVLAMLPDPNGKILVGGSFGNIGGGARSYLARLNGDGTLDTGFSPALNESVSAITLQTDGKILIAGSFTSPRTYLARLTSSGALDTGFIPNPNIGLGTIALQSDGKIIVGGNFTSISGVARTRIARLLNDNVSQSLNVPSANRVEWLRSGALPEAQWVNFDVSVDGGSVWLPLGLGTRISGGWELTGISLPGSGQLRARGRAVGGANNDSSWFVEATTSFSGLPAPEIVVEQPAGTSVVDGESRNFGSLLLGNNAAMTFTISNAGNADLTGISITKDGVHSNDFALDTSGMSATIAAGASTTFTVTFAPGALGARNAAIHIANNDADENPFDIALTGAGVAPEIAVQQPPGTNLVDGATTNDFGSIIPGTSSAAKTFTITNSGSSTLNALAITVDGANPGDFAVDNSGVTASLAPGASATFSVTFTPPIAGSRSAALHIASDDADENPFDINLIGTGLNQSPVVANPIPNQNATATIPFAYTFPANTFNDADAAQSLTYVATRTTGGALPAWLTFTPATRTFSGTPSPADVGTLDVRVIATDNGTPSLSATDAFEIVIAPIAPSVATSPATSPGSYGATLQAVINPNGLPTTAQFEYGPTTSYGSIATITLSPNDGASAQNVSATIAGLTPNVTYHFRATATNSAGGNAGADLTFVTDPPPPGIADTNFNPSANFGVWSIAMQPDGKILLGGGAISVGGRSYVPRLNPDGTTDMSFNPFNILDVSSVVVLPDGKVFAGGEQHPATGIKLVLMNPDGSLVPGFDINAFSGYVDALALQPDGKLAVAGGFSLVYGTARTGLARLNTDYTLDAGFNPNPNSRVSTVVLQPDGKMIIGGLFTIVGGQARSYLARINANGTIDTSFTAGANSFVFGSALQPDGKILINGWFNQVNGQLRNHIARLNADGTLDTGFNPVVDFDVETIAVQTDGKILMGGTFTTVSGQTRNRIARLNSNGTLDPLFNPDASIGVYSIAQQADGKIIVGGQFTNISGQAHARLARLNNDLAPQSLTAPSSNRVEWLRGGASPEASAVTFDVSTDGGVFWSSLGAGTRIAGGWEKTGFVLPANGLVRARARIPGGRNGASSGLIEAIAPFSGFPVSAPFAITMAASSISPTGATLNASVNAGGAPTTAQFDYGLTTSYGSVASITLSPNNSAGTLNVSAALGGLQPNTTYHFRVSADNAAGNSLGADLTFTTATDPEIAVQQPAGADLVDGSSTVAYGNAVVGTSMAKTFTVTNTGLGTLNLSGVTKNGANAGDFTVGAFSATNLPTGASATFTVMFTPAALGARSAAIHIGNNDLNENPFDIALTGTGTAPEIVVEQPIGTDVPDGGSRSFGSIAVGGVTNLTFTIKNLGTADLTGLGITVNGADAAMFTVVTNPTAPVSGPSGSTTFTVRFAPTGGGSRNAALHIANNDADENPFDINLSGGGVPSTNANLSNLALSAGTLTPVFSPATTSYVVSVSYTSGTMRITPTTEHPGATVTVNGATVASGSPSGNLRLNEGDNLITVVVTAQDGTAMKTYALNVTRAFGTTGEVDPTFGAQAGGVYAIAVQLDQKVLLGGTFTFVNGQQTYRFTRVLTNGSIDGTLAAANLVNSVSSIIVQRDEQILVGGWFGTIAGVTRNNFARLNPNGTVESTNTFNPGSGPNNFLIGMALQPDGKILIVGSFTTYNGQPRNGIARILPNGTVESTNTFNAGSGPAGWIYGMAVQPDGKILLVGDFTAMDGQPRNYIARLNPDGSVESTNTFHATFDGQNPNPRCLAVQADGKILVGGIFDRINGQVRNGIARLHPDGTVENTSTFSGSGVGGVVNSIGLQADGKILVGGSFTAAGGQLRKNIARLHPNGTAESTNTFNLGSGPNNSVYDVALQADGKIIIGGFFTSINGQPRDGLARLANDPAIQTLATAGSGGVRWTRGGTAPEVEQVSFELSNDGGGTWALLGTGTRVVGGWELDGLSLPASGHLRARGRTLGAYENLSSGLVQTIAAFSPAAEIDVQQPAGNRVHDGATKSFGRVLTIDSTNLTFVITNMGVADLTGLNISIDGLNASEFLVTASPASTLAPNASTPFTIQFTPGGEGLRVATLHIASNDSDENPYDIVLAGTGVGLAEIAVEQPTGTDLSSGASVDLGTVFTGNISRKTFTVRNTGVETLTGLSISTDGVGAQDFIIGSFGVTNLAPGSNTTFTVTFFPSSAGAKSAAIHIASNDGDENPFDINLSGTGAVSTQSGDIAVYYVGVTELFDAASWFNFGNRRIGGNSSVSYTIKNVGESPLTNIVVWTDGPHGGDFIPTSLTASALSPDGSATFDLVLSPSAVGNRTGTVHIASSDLDENPFEIFVAAYGVTNFPPTLSRAWPTLVVPVNTVATNYGTVGDPDGDAVTLTASLGVITRNGSAWGWSYTPTMFSTQTVIITANDSHELSTVSFTVICREMIPPTAAFVAVTPDPRTNAVGTVTLNFSEDVSGVNASDFILTRNGSAVSLAGLVVTPVSPSMYELQLAPFTAAPGNYVLTLVAAGSGIIDSSGNALAGNASEAFSVAPSSGGVSGGNLSINNAQGAGDMDLTLRIVNIGGTNYIQVRDTNHSIVAGPGAIQVDSSTIRVPLSAITGELRIAGGPGDDRFVFDVTSGCPFPPGGVSVDGGGQGSGGDLVQVIGGFSSVQYDVNNPGAGIVTTDCGRVNFTGLEPVDFTIATITNLAVNVDPSNQFAGPVTTILSVMPGAGHQAHTRVGFSGGLELMDFGTLTGTLTLTGDSTEVDTIVLQGVGTNFAGHLAIAAQVADSILLTNTTLTLRTGKNFDLAAGSVTVGAATVSGGTVAFHGGSIAMNIGGAAPGAGANQYSRLTVNGVVALSNNPSLNLTGSYVPQPGETFMLINNDGTDAIVGTFAGLPEGANFVFNGATLHITYAGGSGNDIVLSVPVPPTINCGQNETLNLGFSWDFTVPIVAANCGTATLSILSTTTNQTCGASFIATRVWLATNTCGLSTTCTQVVTIIDVTGPTIVCPSNITVACAGQIPPADFAGGSAADDGSNPTVIHLGDVSSGVNPRTITRSYRATDACGNSTTCFQTITVHDTNAPTVNCPADIVVAADTNSCTASSTSLGTPIVADNCSVTFTNNAPAIFQLGTTLVTWTATDAVGNNATCTQRVTVVDVSLAITEQPQNSTNNIGTTVTFAVTAVGCAELSYQWCLATNILAGETNQTLTLTNLQASQGGDYSVKVSNAGGSVTSTVAVLVVGDFIAPAISCPSNVTVQCLVDVPPTNFAGGSVSDNLDPSPTIVHVGDATNGACPLIITRTYRATDASNNTAVCAQTITVHDTTPPIINCGQNETLPVGLSWDFTVPIVSDNCGGSVTLSIQNTATNQNCGRTFVATRVWIASDVCGNSTTCTQVVTIIDVAGPALTCPSNLIVACAAEIPVANFAGGSVTDDGDPSPTVVHLSDTSSGSNPRIITRTYRATDACGNATTCSQSITVHDTNAPTMSCAADVVVAADTNACTASSVTLGTPIVGDNCTVAFTNNAPLIFPLGTTWVTWTATDAVGNSSVCTQRVTVIDTSLAITSQPQSSTNNIGTDVTLAVTAAGCPDLSYQWRFGTNDLAGKTNATFALTNIQPNQAGDYSVKVSNAGGSITSAVAVLKVNTAPVLPALSDRTIAENTALIETNAAADADVPANSIVYQLVSPPAGANIDTNGVITWTPGEEQGPGAQTFTTVATDEGGLSATNSFIVFVTEVNSPPTVNPISDRTVNPGQTVTFTATATDAERPTNTLSFSLLTPPSGASIDSNGLFLWRPTMAQRDTTNVIRVRVQDDGSPSLSGTNSFSVIVNPLAPVILKSISYSEFDVSGTAGPDYIIMASPDLLNWTGIVTNVSPAIPFRFNDASAGAFSNRFYKVRLAP
jgi:uncharacterized delta-60 repeat protein